ncbi:hypothetical protein EVAR_9283_1 [Eumeta japonica]|uniref:Uncharacterized protein n=1 Tax=Eumeta variegata TaxID=151549 RepID=A0A4C1TN02_EUMVA|nr:hypothetical protein EVAR_9283_1 [Eumeta japonica]
MRACGTTEDSAGRIGNEIKSGRRTRKPNGGPDITGVRYDHAPAAARPAAPCLGAARPVPAASLRFELDVYDRFILSLIADAILYPIVEWVLSIVFRAVLI